MKWEDFFEVQYRYQMDFEWAGSEQRLLKPKKHYALITKGQGFGCWPRYTTEGYAICAAKAKFRHMMKKIEKDLLG